MRYFLLMIAVVALVGGCASTPTNWISDPSDPNNVLIEEQIRFYAKKPTGELTKVDLDKVTELGLGSKKLTDLKGLEQLTKLTKLKRLSLGNNRLTDLEGLETLTQLTGLHIDFVRHTDLSPLAKLTKMDDIYLGYSQITDAGLKEVAKLQELTRLDLAFTPQITGAGFKEVAKLSKLTWLRLEGASITDTGLKEIAKLQNLTVLDLASTKVTKAGVAELQKALPKCKIRSNPTK